jgi:hypothetical protein
VIEGIQQAIPGNKVAPEKVTMDVPAAEASAAAAPQAVAQ